MTLSTTINSSNTIKVVATKQGEHILISIKNNERDIHPIVCIVDNKVMYYGRIVQDLIQDLL